MSYVIVDNVRVSGFETASKALGATTYIVLLFANYDGFSHTYFDHFGIQYERPGLFETSIVVALLVCVASVLPNVISRGSQFLVQILFMLLVCPITVIFVASSATDSLDAIAFLLAVTVGLLIVHSFTFIRPFQVSRLAISEGQLLLALLIVYVLGFTILFASFGFKLPTSIFDVYEVRLQARDVFTSGFPGIGYLIRWTANALGPALFLIALVKKKHSLMILAIMGQVAIYSFDATKVSLFSLLFVWAAWFLIQRGYGRAWFLYVGGGLILVLVPAIDLAIGNDAANFLFVRRIFYMPAAASLFYFDAFSMSEAFFWSGSVLSGWLNPPIEYLSPAFYVGSTRFGSSVVSANANFLSSAYANAGYLGMLLMATALGVVLWVYDSVSRRSGSLVAVPLIAVPAFALTNSALPAAFLTHGLLPCIVLAYLIGSATRSSN